MRVLTITALLVLLSACSSTPQTSTTTVVSNQSEAVQSTEAEASSEADESAENERIVCRQEQVVGSNRKNRVCRKIVTNN